MSQRALGIFAFSCFLSLAGCSFVGDTKSDTDKRDDADRTRDEVAKATERAKPKLQEAGRELKEAAKTAAEQAHAAAQGVKEGWERGGHREIDVNSASKSELLKLPGITRREADRIIAGRPYSAPHELVSKGILSADRYSNIRGQITTK
jgi:DNA uptake protein ComE-like DNA-binding protein